MLSKITHILEGLEPITLEEMRNVHLMDRIDSKFVAPAALLPQLLQDMEPYFRVQLNNGTRIAPYCTQYLDTPQLDTFVMHQNGRLTRQKIRIRTYMDSQISFLEIKNKNNKGRTKKIRVPIDRSHIDSIEDMGDNRLFLDENCLFHSQTLSPSLGNNFKRITCVNNRLTERVTIDLDLSFNNYNTGNECALGKVVILELKQDGWQRSDFRDLLMNLRIKQHPFSKYCMGTALTNPGVKQNRFKPRLLSLNKFN